MFRRYAASLIVGLALLAVAGCHHSKAVNPIANVNSKQPDKVLFDRAMDAMKHGKYDVARITLQTMINTYPDSEYVARAKLAVGDSWYNEGGTAALQQAEIEYKDFITFFPNMPEAAEAQLKVANIHFNEMEKPDRDFTHAKRAEEEYRNLIQQFPDSKLVPEAKERLREVQEVLAEREFRIGRFYYLRESWAAAIARLKTVTDTYQLYSKADDALMMLGDAYERQIDQMRKAKLQETAKGEMIAMLKKHAQDAYDRVITRYPVGGDADKARDRLKALNLPVPTPTEEAIAQNKAEEQSRGSEGRFGRLMSNFHKAPSPTMAEAAKVGEPTLTDPQQTGAPDIVRQTTAELLKAATDSASKASVEVVGKGQPAANEAPPRTDKPAAVPATTTPPAGSGNPQPASTATAPQQPAAAQPDNTGIQDLAAQPGAVVAPAAPAQPPATSGTAPAPPPNQVNDAGTPADQAQSSQTPVDSSKDSSSQKGKKKKKDKKQNPKD